MTHPSPDFAHFITCPDCAALVEVGEPHTCDTRPGMIRLIDLEMADLIAVEAKVRKRIFWRRARPFLCVLVPILCGVIAGLVYAS